MPSWYSIAGAKTPRESVSPVKSSMPGRSIALPICRQLTRSRLWNTGMPGNQPKVEVTR